MSKRIAYIFKGSASDGVNPKPLEHLTNNVEKIEEVLKNNGAWDVKYFDLDNAQTLKDALNNVMEVKGIEEFLFYYTGHGKCEQDTYYLIGENESRINLLDAFSLHDTYTQKVSVVIDACESHTLINLWENERPYELLVATKTGLAYEDNLSEMSDFSHCFYEAFQTIAKKTFKLKDIYAEMEGKLPKQEPDYVEIKSRERSVIGHNKELNKLTNFLKENHTLKALKESLLTFYPRRGSNHYKIRHTDSFKELFSILFNEKECLTCILKQLNFESPLLSEDETVDCEDLRRKASEENKIDKLIIKVDEDTEKNLVSATISGYYGYSSGAYSPTKTLTGLDLSSEKSLVEIPKYIEEVLIGKKARTIELQLILPDVLLPLNYQTEAMNTRFDILKRLVRRLNNHHLINIEDEIDYWEENSQLIDEMKKNRVMNHIDNRGHVSQYNKHEKNIAMLYNESLSSQIKEMYDWGVPILFYPHNAYEMIERLNLNDCVVANVKNEMSKFMSDEFLASNATHFIYDDYNDVDFLPNTDI